MKRTLLIFSFVFILSSALLLSFPSLGARAASLGDATKGVTSILHLKAADPQAQRNNPGEEGDHENNPLPEFRVPLGKGFKAFLGLTPQQPSGGDVSAVFGFHIPLK